MLTRRLIGVEQLERKDLFAGLLEAPQLSPSGPYLPEQTSFTCTLLEELYTGTVLSGSFAGTILQTGDGHGALSNTNGLRGDAQTSIIYDAGTGEL